MEAKIWHDSIAISDADEKACILFRCTLGDLIGKRLVDFVVDEDFKGLSRLRAVVLRDKKKLPSLDYLLARADGSLFIGRVDSVADGEDGRYRTTVKWLFDV